ncbi:MAG TPA: methyltransferase domain-containing protein [bacterium]|nr:methyltransferase domain-containing protein [bacterium]
MRTWISSPIIADLGQMSLFWREGALRLLAWGRYLWPLRLIAKREAAAAARLMARVPVSREWMADLGCGAGSAPAAQRPEPCIGVDRSRRMARRAAGGRMTHVVCAGINVLPLASARFELVLAVGVAEYLADPEPLLREAARILRREGWLLFTVAPRGWHLAFRRLAGLPVYIHREEDLAGIFPVHHLEIRARAQTATQHLYLLQKVRASAVSPSPSWTPASAPGGFTPAQQ